MTVIEPHGIQTEVLIGKASAQWPIHVFTTDAQAISWMETHEDIAGTKRLFRARIEILSEVDVRRSEPELVTKP